MDTVLLLFLLAMLSANPQLKESLTSFLGFYRENRDLITSLVKESAPASAPAPSAPSASAPPAPPEKKESRPQEVGKYDVLEKYLGKML